MATLSSDKQALERLIQSEHVSDKIKAEAKEQLKRLENETAQPGETKREDLLATIAGVKVLIKNTSGAEKKRNQEYLLELEEMLKEYDANLSGAVKRSRELGEEEMAKGGEINFKKTHFNSHENHNPNYDILEGYIDADSFITYTVKVRGDNIGHESMEYYSGENYVVGSKKKSSSRNYEKDKIPTRYKEAWLKLKHEYETENLKKINQSEYKNGGLIKDQYEGKSAEYVWNKWTVKQRHHFLEDHDDIIDDLSSRGKTETTQSNIDIGLFINKKYNELPDFIKETIINHVEDGQYKDGGSIYDYYQVDYYATVGQHGTTGENFTDFNEAYLNALKFKKQEEDADSLKELQYIGVNGSGNEFAVVYVTDEYLKNTSEKDFGNKESYDSWKKIAQKTLKRNRAHKGKFEAEYKKGGDVKFHFKKGELAPEYQKSLNTLHKVGSDLYKHDFKEEKKFRKGLDEIGDVYSDNTRELYQEYKNGGELKKGEEVEKEHISTAKKLYSHEITPAQAAKSIAKEHLEEDPEYYTKLEQVEKHAYRDGGRIDLSKHSDEELDKAKIVRLKSGMSESHDEIKQIEAEQEKRKSRETIPNYYQGKSDKEVWDIWTPQQRRSFLSDHAGQEDFANSGEYERYLDSNSKSSYEDLSDNIKTELKHHKAMGSYEKGGEIGYKDVYKIDFNKIREKIESHPKVKNFIEEMSGAYEIEFKNGKSVYATPFWEEEKEIPVSLLTDDEEKFIGSVKTSKTSFKDDNDFIEWYYNQIDEIYNLAFNPKSRDEMLDIEKELKKGGSVSGKKSEHYIHPEHKEYCDKGTHVQSLIFPKDKFSLVKARQFLRKHGYRFAKVDSKKNTLRFRQESPLHFRKDSFRTISFGSTGIQAIIGCPTKKYADGGEIGDCGCGN